VEIQTTPDREKGEISHRWPQLLPGGKAVLLTIHALSGRQDEGRIAILALDTGERRVVLHGGTYGRYVPTGHLVYASGGTLFAAPFDLDRIQVTGLGANSSQALLPVAHGGSRLTPADGQ